MIKVLIIDNYPTTCIGLSIVLKKQFKNFKIYTEGTFLPTIKKAVSKSPDLIILGLNVNIQSDLCQMISNIKTRYPHTRLIIYDENTEISQKVIYPGLGVHGYLLQKNGLDELYNCIKTSLEFEV